VDAILSLRMENGIGIVSQSHFDGERMREDNLTPTKNLINYYKVVY
jgi:hypothetical protein